MSLRDDKQETGICELTERPHLSGDQVSVAGWRKGALFVNGVNLGRYWDKGPQQRLYLPATLLVPGDNELVILEQEAVRPGLGLGLGLPGLGLGLGLGLG